MICYLNLIPKVITLISLVFIIYYSIKMMLLDRELKKFKPLGYYRKSDGCFVHTPKEEVHALKEEIDHRPFWERMADCYSTDGELSQKDEKELRQFIINYSRKIEERGKKDKMTAREIDFRIRLEYDAIKNFNSKAVKICD
jgi:hypothetical protein